MKKKTLDLEMLQEDRNGELEDDSLIGNYSLESENSADTVLLTSEEGVRKVGRFSSLHQGYELTDKTERVSLPEKGELLIRPVETAQPSTSAIPKSTSCAIESTPAIFPRKERVEPLRRENDNDGSPVHRGPQMNERAAQPRNQPLRRHIENNGSPVHHRPQMTQRVTQPRYEPLRRQIENNGSPVHRGPQLNQRDPQPRYVSEDEN
ncbi:uncharacterized protein LOC117176213 [Belonocnema kinseyi]|uniref:uncharacterized protein LOC117176213 n=1 Tax=Belonocnema kinseyi TaxID=2817044 RepID=UPI00143CD803|nr:uncharacterized protein LOC117176213 [Belonocnema kinseyi]XP_033222237.1 uncharacterized protein LOC117176213 [Belonocnema kinseyi]XP_033222238.1 uncharacterized protein LOC117176213 [Belonocnema kinseyi]